MVAGEQPPGGVAGGHKPSASSWVQPLLPVCSASDGLSGPGETVPFGSYLMSFPGSCLRIWSRQGLQGNQMIPQYSVLDGTEVPLLRLQCFEVQLGGKLSCILDSISISFWRSTLSRSPERLVWDFLGTALGGGEKDSLLSGGLLCFFLQASLWRVL